MSSPSSQRLSRVRAAAAVAPVLAALALAAGCGGSSDNGVASKSASEILAASKSAAAGASSVYVRVHNTQGKLSAKLVLTLSQTAGSAQVESPEGNFEVVRIGQTLYVKGSPQLYRTIGLTAPTGTWLKTTTADARVGALAGFTEIGPEVANLLTASGPVSKGVRRTVNGQKAVELRQTTQVFRGALYIATTGKPYPIAAQKTGLVSGTATFTGWNKPVSIAAPAPAVNINEAKAAG